MNKKLKYGIRKLSVGVFSLIVGATFAIPVAVSKAADTNTGTTNTNAQDSQVKVHFIDKDTQTAIKEHQIGNVDEQPNIEGYYARPNEVRTETIDDVEHKYFYYRKEGTLTFIATTLDGTEISRRTVKGDDTRDLGIPNTTDTTYDINLVKYKPGNELVPFDNTDYHFVSGEEIVFRKQFEVKTGTVQVQNVDKLTGTVLSEEVPFDHEFGEPILITDGLPIDGYDYIETVGNDIVLTDQTPNVIVTRYYLSKTVKGVVQYIDNDTNTDLTNQLDIVGNHGDEINAEQKTFNDYVFVERTGPTHYDRDVDNTVIFKYRKKANIQYTVKYVDEITGREIADSKTVDIREGASYNETPVSVNNYEHTTTEGVADGVAGNENFTITFKYKNTEKGTVVIKHLDKETGQVLFNDETIEDIVGTKIPLNHKNSIAYRPIVELTETTIESGNKVINLYYERINSKLSVVHIDIDSGANLLTPTLIDGLVGNTYTTTAGTFAGYVFVDVQGVPNGVYSEGTTSVVYRYKRQSGSIVVKHIDVDTKANLLDPITQTNFVGNEFSVKGAVIEGYELVDTLGNTTGVFALDTKEITFEYRKTNNNVNPDGTVGNDTTNGTPKVLEGPQVDIDEKPVGKVLDKPTVNVEHNTNHEIPSTNDNILLYGSLGAVALVILAVLLFYKKKEK